MLHHLSLAVANVARSTAFMMPRSHRSDTCAYERTKRPSATGCRAAVTSLPSNSRAPFAAPPEGFHVAFAAPSREAVDAFHRAALALGGVDNGGTGLHPEYGPGYYAAFVIDPNGYRIEAMIK